ncbi:MAG: phage tail protein [Pseudomonadota bacterium]
MSGDKQEAPWPLPRFYFSVDIGGTEASFRDINGLDTETQIIEYRSGNSPDFSVVKMPGIKRTGNVVLRKGVFAKDNAFWDWYSQIKLNTIERQTVTIKLLDEAGAPTMVWTLKNAWPTKVTGTELDAEANEAAIEMLELAHEGLMIENG